jgi:hypothetical protein
VVSIRRKVWYWDATVCDEVLELVEAAVDAVLPRAVPLLVRELRMLILFSYARIS